MSFTLRQWANDVDSLLCERLGGGYRHQFLSGKALDIAEPLALVAFLDELPCDYLYGRPEVTRSDNFTYQGSEACMVFANPFMDLFQNILDFLFIHALQVRYGKTSLIQCVIQDRESGCFLPNFLASSTSCERCPS